MNNHIKWLLLGGLGLALTGMGLCFAIEAGFVKHEEAGNNWILLGTGALIVFNAGLAVIGEANFARVKYLLEKDGKEKN